MPRRCRGWRNRRPDEALTSTLRSRCPRAKRTSAHRWKGLAEHTAEVSARSIERFSRTGSGHPRRPHPRDLRAAAPGRHAHGTSGGHPPRVSERDRRRVLVCGTFESPHARLCFCVLTVSPTAFPAPSTSQLPVLVSTVRRRRSQGNGCVRGRCDGKAYLESATQGRRFGLVRRTADARLMLSGLKRQVSRQESRCRTTTCVCACVPVL